MQGEIEIVESPKKKINKTRLVIILVSIIVLVLLSLCVYNNYLRKLSMENTNNDEVNENNDYNDQNNNNTIIEEDKKDVDYITREKLNSILAVLLYSNDKFEDTTNISYINSDFLLKGLTEKRKIEIILDSIKVFDVSTCNEVECIIVSEEAFKDKYKKIFNEDVTNQSVSDEEVNCHEIIYDEKNKEYHIIEGDGCPYDSGALLFYPYKYEYNDLNIDVYLAVAGVFEDDEGNYSAYKLEKNDGEDSFYGFSLNNSNVVVKDIDIDSFKLNDENYKDFTNFKITFAKNGNEYYYKSIERIK